MTSEPLCDGCALAARQHDNTIDRRTFIANSAVAAAALILAACALDATAPGVPSSIGKSIKVAYYSRLTAIGGVALVTLNGAPLAIVRTGDTSFAALSRVCPHQGGAITTSSNGFRCTRHGALFNTTGMWTGGQPTSNMRSYPTQYDPSSDTLSIG